jgi:hypothetical protein
MPNGPGAELGTRRDKAMKQCTEALNVHGFNFVASCHFVESILIQHLTFHPLIAS